jgi:hypothetical protein
MNNIAAPSLAFNKRTAIVTGLAHNSFAMLLQLAPASHAINSFALACSRIWAV